MQTHRQRADQAASALVTQTMAVPDLDGLLMDAVADVLWVIVQAGPNAAIYADAIARYIARAYDAE